MRTLTLASVLVALAALLTTGGGVMASDKHQMALMPGNDHTDWQPGPPSLPEGAEVAPLLGDPAEPGPFVLRVKFPPNTMVPPHSHPTTENLTILSGTLFHGMGEEIDKTQGDALTAGGFVYLPGGMNHYVWTEDEESIVQVTGTGPFDLVYVNPADDPRNAD